MTASATTGTERPVVIIDLGAQYTQLIARRVRQQRIYSEVVPHTMPWQVILDKNPLAIILSGGAASVYDPDAPRLDPQLLDSGIPVLGICYGFQLMAHLLGGQVKPSAREYGSTMCVVDPHAPLFQGLDELQTVWMSHQDQVIEMPAGFRGDAHTPGTAIAAMHDDQRRLYGVQWHPEVSHTPGGIRTLQRFLFDVAGIEPTWTPAHIADQLVQAVRQQVGEGHAVCGLSGGVDSAVAAALVQRAIGDRLTCVFVDHGLLRQGEREQVVHDFHTSTGARLVVLDAQRRFLDQLTGVTDPELKRKAIGAEFIAQFKRAVEDIRHEQRIDHIEFLVQGTLYPDWVESGGGVGAANIKSHHNVGGLPEQLGFELVEPLKYLFKDEVRELGLHLGLPDHIVQRQPFPGPGLAVRIIGEVTEERLRILRAADAIARQELEQLELDPPVWQCPVVLLADVRSVGVQGDGRTYGHPIVLRPVTSEDAMTADWARIPAEALARISNRITNEVPEVNRVVLDITSKPPGTIEWE